MHTQFTSNVVIEDQHKQRSSVLFIFIIIFFSIASSIAGYAIRTMTVSSTSALSSTNQVSNQPLSSRDSFMKSIYRVWNIGFYNNAKGTYQKVAITYDDQFITMHAYLTDAYLNSATAIDLAGELPPALGVEFNDISTADGEKTIFYLYMAGPGDGQSIMLADNTGKIISRDVLSKNAGKLGLGTTIPAMYGAIVKNLSRSGPNEVIVLTIEISSGNGKKYEAMIDALTGDYINGTLQEIK